LFFNILLMGIGIGFTLCDKNGTHAAPPYFWLPIAFVGGILHLYDEILIVQRSGIPFIQEVTHFRTLSQKLGFGPWFAFGLFNSLMDYLGTVSYTIVTATWITKMWRCPDERLDKLWAYSLSKSHLFHSMHDSLHLGFFACFVWIATNLRLLHTLGGYWPWKVEAKDGYRPKYFNIFGQEVNRVEYFQFISEQVGCDCIAQTVVEYRKARCNANIVMIAEELEKNNRKVQEEWAYVLGDLYSCLRHVTTRLFGHKLVKSVALLLQVYLVAMDKALKEDPSINRQLLSIFFAFAAAGPTVISIVELQRFISSTIWPLAIKEDFKDPDGNVIKRGYTDNRGHNLKYSAWIFGLAWVAYILMHVFVVIRLAMVFRCPDSLWNISWPLDAGCVDASGAD